ncbi:conserved phage C-terminal domain-containing protein [Sporosarcina ureilytica]|uniref:Phage conserved hypothetical protein C-terminal domain-containing protein n=1 Tax=Sporosarcina ureilytica TaxID=298596 RepID=A0A1D8JF89_9BACL|nr:conserved phage C-terminal domain-containing protein [Sporosarcina ureilytica]AOV07369.1 hypothetical protein BI350_07335 [Sporosarcina ureilytica]
MKLLLNESPLQVLPSLATKIGLNEAIFLQQLHFRLLISKKVRDGHIWHYKTYDEWHVEEFPFWSTTTIKRIIRKLENEGYIISTSSYNRMVNDKTKWYRIDYSKIELLADQNDQTRGPQCTLKKGQCDSSSEAKLDLPITKENKRIKKDTVGKHPDVVSIINYLNEKTGKHFKASSKATERYVNARLREGYELDDFKNVIDYKVTEWLHNAHWNKYLRPSTLFNATNFENYLEEYRGATEKRNPPVHTVAQPFELDFSKGEV